MGLLSGSKKDKNTDKHSNEGISTATTNSHRGMVSSPSATHGIVSIELANGSAFKLSFNSSTTGAELLEAAVEKAHLGSGSLFFGLQFPPPSEISFTTTPQNNGTTPTKAPTSKSSLDKVIIDGSSSEIVYSETDATGAASAAENNTPTLIPSSLHHPLFAAERLFLADSLPVAAQGLAYSNERLLLSAMKFSPFSRSCASKFEASTAAAAKATKQQLIVGFDEAIQQQQQQKDGFHVDGRLVEDEKSLGLFHAEFSGRYLRYGGILGLSSDDAVSLGTLLALCKLSKGEPFGTADVLPEKIQGTPSAPWKDSDIFKEIKAKATSGAATQQKDTKAASVAFLKELYSRHPNLFQHHCLAFHAETGNLFWLRISEEGLRFLPPPQQGILSSGHFLGLARSTTNPHQHQPLQIYNWAQIEACNVQKASHELDQALSNLFRNEVSDSATTSSSLFKGNSLLHDDASSSNVSSSSKKKSGTIKISSSASSSNPSPGSPLSSASSSSTKKKGKEGGSSGVGGGLNNSNSIPASLLNALQFQAHAAAGSGRSSLVSELLLNESKCHKLSLNISFSNLKIDDVSLILLSKSAVCARFAELCDFYSWNAKNGDPGKLAKFRSKTYLDDPKDLKALQAAEAAGLAFEGDEKLPSNITCIAIADNLPQNAESGELIFNQGDELLIIKKLSDDRYMGEFKGKPGLIKGSLVKFKTRPKVLSSSENLANNSELEAKTTTAITEEEEKQNQHQQEQHGGSKESNANNANNNMIVAVHLEDGSRVKIMQRKDAKVNELKAALVEKLELDESSSFEICAVKSEGSSSCFYWLQPTAPLIEQVFITDKIMLRVRLLPNSESMASGTKAMKLIFAQISKSISTGELAVKSEETLVELSALRLQAANGDIGVEGKSNFTKGLSIEDLIPPVILAAKFDITTWQKKLSAAQIEIKGISKDDAEKIFVTMAEKLPLYYYNTQFEILTPTAAAVLILGISHDSLILMERSTMEVLDTFHYSSETAWTNNGFSFCIDHLEGNKSFGGLSLKTVEILENLEIGFENWQRQKLSTKSRNIRKFLKLFLQPEDLPPPVSYRNQDPDLLVQSLRNGILLCKLMNEIMQICKNSQANDNCTLIPIIFEKSENNEAALAMKNLSSFLIVGCQQFLGIPEKDCFVPQALYESSLGTIWIAFTFIIDVFMASSKVENAVKIVKEQAEASKISSPTSSDSPKMDLRTMVINEIINTERSYVNDLSLLIENILQPIRQNQLLSNEMISIIFGNIESLLQHQRMFLESLEEVHSSQSNIYSTPFLLHSHSFLSPYQDYCSRQAEVHEVLLSLKDNAKLVNYFNADEAWHGRLASTLIKPVQRILKYHLLLQELIKATPSTEPDYEPLKESLAQMKSISLAINEVQRKRDLQKSLSDLLSKLSSSESSSLGDQIRSLGNLLNEGVLTVSYGNSKNSSTSSKKKQSESGNFHFYLFRTALFYFKELTTSNGNAIKALTISSASSSNSSKDNRDKDNFNNVVTGYKFKASIDLSTLSIPSQEELKQEFSFELCVNDAKLLYLTARCVEDKERWLNVLKAAMEALKNPVVIESPAGVAAKLFKEDGFVKEEIQRREKTIHQDISPSKSAKKVLKSHERSDSSRSSTTTATATVFAVEQATEIERLETQLHALRIQRKDLEKHLQNEIIALNLSIVQNQHHNNNNKNNYIWQPSANQQKGLTIQFKSENDFLEMKKNNQSSKRMTGVF